jgi:hypothetical protein
MDILKIIAVQTIHREFKLEKLEENPKHNKSASGKKRSDKKNFLLTSFIRPNTQEQHVLFNLLQSLSIS